MNSFRISYSWTLCAKNSFRMSASDAYLKILPCWEKSTKFAVDIVVWSLKVFKILASSISLSFGTSKMK